MLLNQLTLFLASVGLASPLPTNETAQAPVASPTAQLETQSPEQLPPPPNAVSQEKVSCSAFGNTGLCMSTGACSNQGGGSIPGYCPGAADIQCCLKIACNHPNGDGVCKSKAVQGQCGSSFVTGKCPGPDGFACCGPDAPSNSAPSALPSSPAPSIDLRMCIEVTATRQGLVQAGLALVQSGATIQYSQDMVQRWSGISGYVCPNKVPPVADCSSFQTWLYWTAFGKGPDKLNGMNWKAGYTGTMTQSGRGKIVTLAEAQPGDLVFYGAAPTYDHVAMYIGNNQVLNYGSTGPVKVMSINGFQNFGYTYSQIRSYPFF